MFKDSLCREKLTNLDAKCSKRSVKMWTTNSYMSFFKNILLYMNGGRLSKIRSVHTYVTVYPGRFNLVESVWYILNEITMWAAIFRSTMPFSANVDAET